MKSLLQDKNPLDSAEERRMEPVESSQLSNLHFMARNASSRGELRGWI